MPPSLKEIRDAAVRKAFEAERQREEALRAAKAIALRNPAVAEMAGGYNSVREDLQDPGVRENAYRAGVPHSRRERDEARPEYKEQHGRLVTEPAAAEEYAERRTNKSSRWYQSLSPEAKAKVDKEARYRADENNYGKFARSE